ncbi:sel1 repeat family protein [Muribacter muris]|uniref:Sel1 repeat family protein n=1 Tax=Muribacter muris TaxID=67855 RepID=A0A4Y9K2B3_9PAST|nr:SEL1-like repeat protein [Muribacter muris]MBF0784448.1 sel1 repeat family protein [Muribacter muris]MBF0826445.1 sel1 repeat family protein [Muribacter muris]TFV12221.1 sel1 repeat family protein [Muribacter muris]
MKFTKTLLNTAFFALSTVSLSPVAYADSAESQFNQAITAYKNQDYTTAFNLLKPLAEQGLAEAQGVLGTMYGLGKGVKQDRQQSKYWAGKACDNGNQKACDMYRVLNERE